MFTEIKCIFERIYLITQTLYCQISRLQYQYVQLYLPLEAEEMLLPLPVVHLEAPLAPFSRMTPPAGMLTALPTLF